MKKPSPCSFEENSAENQKGLPYRYALFLVLILALVLRVAYLVLYAANDPLYDLPLSDSAVYDQMARELAGLAEGERWEGPFYQAPLYPFLLGILYSAVGRNFLLPCIFQGLLGLISIYLIYRSGRELFGRTEGIIAALLATLHGTLIFYESKLLPTMLGVFLTILSLRVLLKAAQSRSLWTWFSGGVCLGLLCLARPHMILVVPLVFLWALFLLSQKGRSRLLPSLSSALLVGAGAAMCILPLTLRNYLESGEFIPIASEWGLNLFIGNNPESKGTNSTPPSLSLGAIEDQEKQSRAIAEGALGKPLKSTEVSKYWAGRVKGFMKSEPLLFLENIYKKILLFLGNFEAGAIFVPNAESHFVPILYALCLPFSFILSVGLFGLLLAVRKKETLLLLFFVFANALSLIIFFSISRLRLPIVPVLAIGAAHGLSSMRKEWTGTRAIQAAGFVLLLGGGAFLFTVIGGRYASACLIAPLLLSLSIIFTVLWTKKRDILLPAGAAASIVLGIYLFTNPVDGLYKKAGFITEGHIANALNGIGAVQMRNNRITAAEDTFERVLEIDPSFTKALNNLFELSVLSVNTAMAEKKPGRAKAYMAKAGQNLSRIRQVDPRFAVRRFTLGLYSHLRGDKDAAKLHLRLALKENPAEFDSAFLLGFLLMTEKKYKQARILFKQALAVIPAGHPKRHLILTYLNTVERETSEK